MRTALGLLGVLTAAAGLLFMLQGGGIVHWPPSSTMLDQGVWIWRGLGVAVLGVVLILASRRIR